MFYSKGCVFFNTSHYPISHKDVNWALELGLYFSWRMLVESLENPYGLSKYT